MSQARAEELEEHDNEEGGPHDGRLDTIFCLCTSRGSPVDLNISGNQGQQVSRTPDRM